MFSYNVRINQNDGEQVKIKILRAHPIHINDLIKLEKEFTLNGTYRVISVCHTETCVILTCDLCYLYTKELT